MKSLWQKPSAGAFWAWWIFFLLAWAGLLALSTGWDLEISQGFYLPDSGLARTVETWGEVPAWCLVAGALAAFVFSRRLRLQRWAVNLAAAVLLLALLEPLLITQTLKFLWGRVRFRDLAPGFSNFTPFYLPAGPGAGESFPSGHVAMALVTSAAAFSFQQVGRLSAVLLAWLLVGAYGGAVSVGRVLAGAHYFTDCLFSAGSAVLLGAVICRVLSGKTTGR